MENTNRDRLFGKIALSAFIILIAVVSLLFMGDKFSSPDAYCGITDSIDSKVETVLKLTASSTMASAGVSAIPGDTATPIAEKLADFTQYFLLILCVLYTEKYLLPLFGFAVFRIIIPLAAVLLIICIFTRADTLKNLITKLCVVAMMLFIAIPISIKISDFVYSTFQDSIDNTIASANELSEETSQLAQAKDDEKLIQAILDKLSQTAADLANKATAILNRFVETMAVLIVTSCILPLLGILFFLWLIKSVTGIDLTPDMKKLRHRQGHGREAEKTQS